MSDGYRFNPLRFDEFAWQPLSALLRTVFPKARHLTPRYLRWLYGDNPDGRAVGCNAFLGTQLVGHMASIPMVATVEGVRKRVLFLVNGSVHPAHRGQRLQSRISAALFEEAAASGYSFVLGTGNKYSTGPLLTRFQLIRPLDAMVGIGRPRGDRLTQAPSFERLWSEEAMRWRFSNPEGRYWARAGQDPSVLASTGVPGVAAVLHEGTGADLPPPPLHSPLRLWLGLYPMVDWKASTFVSVPQVLRPSPLNLVFRDLTGSNEMPAPDRFVFRAIDFDAY